MSKDKKPVKYERIIQMEDCIMIWKYDHSKTKTGPYEVEIKYPKTK